MMYKCKCDTSVCVFSDGRYRYGRRVRGRSTDKEHRRVGRKSTPAWLRVSIVAHWALVHFIQEFLDTFTSLQQSIDCHYHVQISVADNHQISVSIDAWQLKCQAQHGFKLLIFEYQQRTRPFVYTYVQRTKLALKSRHF